MVLLDVIIPMIHYNTDICKITVRDNYRYMNIVFILENGQQRHSTFGFRQLCMTDKVCSSFQQLLDIHVDSLYDSNNIR